ncbi:MAG: hypothetical protein NVS9B7_14510 [Flavisolibacter sp.]
MLLLSFVITAAQDRYFAYTYTSDVLWKGNIDIELWHTSRFGHKNEYYHAIDQQGEVEIGLGKNFQTAFYFNRFEVTKIDSNNSTFHTSEMGLANEWKWKMTNAYTSFLGSALYTEWGLKGDELDLETKIILDKSFGKHLIAFNLVCEFSQAINKVNNNFRFQLVETPIELDLGYLYNIHRDFGLGVEMRNANLIQKGQWKNALLFGGLTLNYRSEKWFLILGGLKQIVNLHKTADFPLNKVLTINENNTIRLILGFSLF